MVSDQQKMLDEIMGMFDTFRSEAGAGMAGNKAAGARARQASLHLRKCLKKWREISLTALRKV
jgi:hypothetical protein